MLIWQEPSPIADAAAGVGAASDAGAISAASGPSVSNAAATDAAGSEQPEAARPKLSVNLGLMCRRAFLG